MHATCAYIPTELPFLHVAVGGWAGLTHDGEDELLADGVERRADLALVHALVAVRHGVDHQEPVVGTFSNVWQL